MKKIVVPLCAAFVLLGALAGPSTAQAAEVKLGIEMMYGWWKPAYLTMEHEMAANLFDHNFRKSSSGTFMMGPMLWAKIAENWTMDFTVLFGLSRNEFDHLSWAADVTLWSLPNYQTYFDMGESKVRRYDLDLKFGYALHKYIDLLIGLRFNYGDGEGSSFRAPLNFKKEEFSNWYLGPSLGIGGHYEFKDFSFGLGTSFICQFGTYNLEKTLFFDWFPGSIPLSWIFPFKHNVGYVSFGLDSYLRVAYLIKQIHLEVFLGGRYVFLGHASISDDRSFLDLTYKKGWIGGEFDHFGGINFGVAYKF